MIQIPLHRRLVEIELRRRHKTISSPNAKCRDLTLQILVESWNSSHDTRVGKSSSATPSATSWPRLMFVTPNTRSLVNPRRTQFHAHNWSLQRHRMAPIQLLIG